MEKLIVLKFYEGTKPDFMQSFTNAVRKHLESNTTKVIGVPSHLVTVGCYGISHDEYIVNNIDAKELLEIIKNKENIL